MISFDALLRHHTVSAQACLEQTFDRSRSLSGLQTYRCSTDTCCAAGLLLLLGFTPSCWPTSCTHHQSCLNMRCQSGRWFRLFSQEMICTTALPLHVAMKGLGMLLTKKCLEAKPCVSIVQAPPPSTEVSGWAACANHNRVTSYLPFPSKEPSESMGTVFALVLKGLQDISSAASSLRAVPVPGL